MRLQLVVVLLAALTVLGTAILAPTAGGSPASPGAQIVVTRDSAQLPSGCSARGVAELLDRFFDAFNRADWPEVETLFAPAGSDRPAFALFAFDRDVVYERDRLVAFLANLRSQGERLRLLSVSVKPGFSTSSSVGVEYRFDRAQGFGSAKGMVECRSQQIWQGALGAWPASLPLGLPCPQPQGWSPDGPTVACTTGPNARALAPTFGISPTKVKLPPRCAPARVRKTVVQALVAFNQGFGENFARHFVKGGQFHPYTRSIKGAGFATRRAIARFVKVRYEAGDGWTVGWLFTPQTAVGRPTKTVYGVALRVSHQGTPVSEELGSKLVLDCGSGHFSFWGGPAIRTPPAA